MQAPRLFMISSFGIIISILNVVYMKKALRKITFDFKSFIDWISLPRYFFTMNFFVCLFLMNLSV